MRGAWNNWLKNSRRTNMNSSRIECTIGKKNNDCCRVPHSPGTFPRPMGRVPRIARLLALALKFDGLLCQGVISHYAALARLGHVSRARVSQIMALINLA